MNLVIYKWSFEAVEGFAKACNGFMKLVSIYSKCSVSTSIKLTVCHIIMIPTGDENGLHILYNVSRFSNVYKYPQKLLACVHSLGLNQISSNNFWAPQSDNILSPHSGVRSKLIYLTHGTTGAKESTIFISVTSPEYLNL